MAPGEASLAAELASVKKTLSKTPLNTLAKSEALVDALRLTTQRTLSEYHADQLLLLSVLLKQLRQALPLTQGSELDSLLADIRDTLNPAVQPGGVIAELLVISLERQTKVNLIRAVECAHALARLSTVVSTYKGGILTLEPLFVVTCDSGLSNKPALLLVENLIDGIPSSSIPSDLLPAVLEGMELPDNGVIRTNIIIGILTKKQSISPIPASDIIDLILPLLDSSASMILTNNINRYLLPALFKSFPHILLSLLSTLSEGSEDTFSSWISIASMGISLGILTVDQLPSSDLHDALGHEDAAVRLKAYDAITGCKDSGMLLTEEVMALVREALEVNAILPGSGARSDFASATYIFFTNLKTASNLARRKQRKPNADTTSSSPEAKSLGILQEFHKWFTNNFIDPALVSARRIPVYRPLFALKLLEVYVSVFGDDEVVRDILFTERIVKLLIGCQASEFTEVRGRARTILGSAPTPLPGYPTIDSPNARALLHSAYESFSNPRRTQNDAAVAGLCIIFEKVLLPLDKEGGKESVAFVDGLIDMLEKELKRGEEGIHLGVDDLALHGLLSAARALLGCVDMKDPKTQLIWQAPMHRLIRIISRVWNLTRTIMSLSASSLEEKEEGPAHEIAKAHQLLSNAQDEDDDGEVDTRKILSACWRATKEASDLLSLIISQPILQAGEAQGIWTKEEVHQAGQQYLVWMHEIRHRGTFSKVALAFASLVEAVKIVPSLRDLAGQWLHLELEAITDDTLSTTRRSAALPYSLLSIVAGDQALLDIAIDRLINLARLYNSSTSDITRVHCFNILKIVLLDARQTKLFGIYFERTVMTAVAAFASNNWNVRNVGLILFSTLVHRSLTPSRGSPDIHASRSTLASRQTFIGWHTKYPSLFPYIIKYMGDLKGTHTPLFPMLIIIRSLRWSDKGGEVQDGLKGVVRPHLGSSERQVREVAAQALSSLFSPTEAVNEVLTWSKMREGDMNAIHGQLLYTRNLINGVIDWSTTSSDSKKAVESILLSKLDEYSNLPCPPIQTELFLCISKYLVNTSLSPAFFDSSIAAAEKVIRGPRSLYPGTDAFLSSAADLVLTYRPSPDIILSLLDNPIETGRLAVLGRFPTTRDHLTSEVYQRVMQLAIDQKSGEAVQLASLNVLASLESEKRGLGGIEGDRSVFLDGVLELLQTKCVPLREAALPAAAWAVSRTLDSKENGANVLLEKVAREISDASLEIQSQPRRETAIKSLLHLTPYLFPTSSSNIDTNILLILHQSLLRLLQDDDEDVRLIAADLIRDGMGYKRSVTQSRAVEGYWAWLTGFMGQLEVKGPWIRWMEDLALSKQDLEEEMSLLQSNKIDNRSYTSADLFAEEKPNLWRDPLDDARHASSLLGNSNFSSRGTGEATRMAEMLRGALGSSGQEGISPIDEGFEVLGILPEYIAILERIS